MRSKDAFWLISSEISSTYETVSHVNNFFGMNISDTPLHVITSSFSAGAYLMAHCSLAGSDYFLSDAGIEHQVNAAGDCKWQ